MSEGWSASPPTALGRLKGLARSTKPRERCELCGEALGPEHEHLLQPEIRRLMCACNACAFLFDQPEAGKYRRVPRRVRLLDPFELDDALWDELRLPINLAFFYHSTAAGRVVATYPSPAGPMDSLLSLESWSELERRNPILATLQPDVEALLVERLGPRSNSPNDQPFYALAPIDKCFELVGLLRMHWRGLSGGTEVWREIAAFFERLRARAEGTSTCPN